MHPFFAKRKAETPSGGGAGGGAGPPKAVKMSSSAAATSSGGRGGGGAIRWSALHQSLLTRTDTACVPNARIAAFDLDDTLQKTKSGRPGYLATVGDFIFWSDEVRPKLRALHARGYKIIIFTNQGGVKGALQGKRAETVRTRIDEFAAEVAGRVVHVPPFHYFFFIFFFPHSIPFHTPTRFTRALHNSREIQTNEMKRNK